MRNLTLELENDAEIFSPKWEEISDAIKSLSPERNLFLVLSDSSGAFVQALGTPQRLTVEFHNAENEQYVLGRRALPSLVAEVLCFREEDGQPTNCIRVYQHEILELTDALVLFKSFFESGSVSDAYLRRPIPIEHLSGADDDQ